MGNQQVTEVKIGWLAGIIDGEGSLFMGNQNKKESCYFTPYLIICNTDPGMILEITKIYESLAISFYIGHRKGGEAKGWFGKKELHTVSVNRLSSLNILLPILIPHLITKRTKAILMFDFVKKRLPKVQKGRNGDRKYTEEELSLVNAFRNLNDYTQGTQIE